ncbi:E3 ubiquitin-protein ligase RNF181-like [Carica papaya]|uniref:E3 ubiquitin-protein ligase RNF181-like n=1 Tax=Carica papaya TaxID=3649 RepID=UPI000B8C9F1E|nr:E3 ubiquitin-protein ligase RNF181-like [Carica papaya]
MEASDIARLKADWLDRSVNWSKYSTYDGSYDPRTFSGKLDDHEMELVKIDMMTYRLARLRAETTNRDFCEVRLEVEMEVMVELARILADTIEPAYSGSLATVVEEEAVVCAVCQDEMKKGEEARAMGCKHFFHPLCIIEWLRRKETCPLCRYQMKPKEFDVTKMRD